MEYGEALDQDTQEPKFLQPWRCASCGHLMYAVDKEGKPVPGAPIGMSMNINGDRKRVCTLCAEMWLVVNSSRYMVDAHIEWSKSQERSKDKLGSGGKYLD